MEETQCLGDRRRNLRGNARVGMCEAGAGGVSGGGKSHVMPVVVVVRDVLVHDLVDRDEDADPHDAPEDDGPAGAHMTVSAAKIPRGDSESQTPMRPLS
eukprot:1632377-Rhodomonas_salina.1